MRDAPALLGVLFGIVSCPHCGRGVALIGHGFLRGYAERGVEQEVRGRRFFCSNRALRPGFAQLLTHFEVVLGAGAGTELFAPFQRRMQRGIFDNTLGVTRGQHA